MKDALSWDDGLAAVEGHAGSAAIMKDDAALLEGGLNAPERLVFGDRPAALEEADGTFTNSANLGQVSLGQL